jgi:iron complex outermembrane receptor protein
MLRITTLALLISSATCAWAQDETLQLPSSTLTASSQSPQEGTRLNLDRAIESGSRLNLSARENPASVSVADRKTMERIGARNFQDAANALPGVNASAPPGLGGYVAYRGFSGAQVSQLFNGINLQYGAAARPVGSWIYDRVELFGGPSSFLNGSGAVGGSLNVITRLASRDEDVFEGRVSYGRYDTAETSIGVNKALNSNSDGPRHYARLDYSRTSSNGYIDRQENGAGNVAFSLLSDINERLSHTLAIEYLEEKEDSPYWGTPTLQPQSGELHIDKHNRFSNYNVEDGRYEQRTRWLRSITDYRLNDSTQLRNTFYHYKGQRDYRNLEVYRYNSDNSQVARSSPYRQRHDQEMNGNRIELSHTGELFGLSNNWAFGLDYSRNQQTNYPQSSTGSFDSVDPGGFDPGHFLDISGMDAPRSKGRSTWTDTSSAFVENQTRLTDQLSLISALRYDHIDFDLEDHVAQNALDRRWDAITGRLGLVYDLTANLSLYTQYSTSAEPPGGTLTSASIAQVGDLDLSTGRQVEVGSKFDFLDGRGTATAAAYRIVRKNVSVPSSTQPNTTEQAGQQTSTGIELAASLKITPKLLLAGNYAWVDAEYDEFNEKIGDTVYSRAGKTPVNTPERTANLWLTYDLAPDWSIGADARYVASAYADTANTKWVPSYTIYGLSMTHDLDEHIQLSARLRNLTDEVYARYIHQSNAQYYLGEPRTLEVAMLWRY